MTMKKIVILSLAALLMLSGCGSYEAAGTYTGAYFGSIVGSAIGGISNGRRGHDVGTLIGLAGGAMVGAAIGRAADNAEADRRYSHYDGPSGINSRMPREFMADASALEISHVEMVDATYDGQLSRGEVARIVFEITNTSSKPVYSVQPSVREMTRNRHIHISENVLVECINPRETIRYTAQIKADNGLRNGEAIVRVAVFQAGREIASQSRELRIQTFKRR